MNTTIDFTGIRFNGSDYNHERDGVRLAGQALKVFNYMKDSKWRSIRDIATEINEPETSVSAQLRNLRKQSFGGHTVDKIHVGDGFWRYRLIEKKHGYI